jgi:hypothetical protein
LQTHGALTPCSLPRAARAALRADHIRHHRWHLPKRDTLVMTRPSIPTDSCHHPTVKDKAHSFVQRFFLLVCIISMPVSFRIFPAFLIARAISMPCFDALSDALALGEP